MGLLFCNLKIEQTKHLAAIACALCFHYPLPLAESLTNLVCEGHLELVQSHLPPRAGPTRASRSGPSQGLNISGEGDFRAPSSYI